VISPDGFGAHLNAVLGDPSTAVLATDFDGTLAPIVADPQTSTPIPGAMECLERLGTVLGEVAIISGRPIEYLQQWAPESVSLFGLYGLQARRHGERTDHPDAANWIDSVQMSSQLFEDSTLPLNVERKKYSLTVHYRSAPEVADQVARLAAEVSNQYGLMVRPAKASLELHPPIDEDKGTTVQRIAGDYSGAVIFAGDDVGDLPAFAALKAIAESGRPTVAMAVDSSEVSPGVLGAADYVAEGPDGVLSGFMQVLESARNDRR